MSRPKCSLVFIFSWYGISESESFVSIGFNNQKFYIISDYNGTKSRDWLPLDNKHYIIRMVENFMAAIRNKLQENSEVLIDYSETTFEELRKMFYCIFYDEVWYNIKLNKAKPL